MKRQLSLSKLITIIGAALTVCVIASLIVSFLVNQRYSVLLQNSQQIAEAGRKFALMDMHHDGSKGALYRILFSHAAQPDALSEAQKDLEGQLAALIKRLDEVKQLETTPEITLALAKVQPVIDAYMKSILNIVETARPGGVANAVSALPAYEKIFSELAVANDAAGNLISQEVENLVEAGSNLRWTAKAVSLAIGLVLLVSFGYVAFFVRKNLTGPLSRLATSIQSLASGTPQQVIKPHLRRDEIGLVFEALSAFQENALKTSELERLEVERQDDEIRRQQRIGVSASAFRDSIVDVQHGLSSGVGDLSLATNNLKKSAADAAEAIATSANLTRGNASSAQQIASATLELNASIAEVALQVGHSVADMSTTANHASIAHKNVQQLAESTTKIESIVGMIRNIAAQTNLLALNATIEAARAGEAGRGFAVVASEVKSLASQTASATDEVAGQIAEILNLVGLSQSAIEDMMGQFGTMDARISSIASVVEQQRAATEEISQSSGSAAESVSSTQAALTEVTLLAERAASAAGSVAQVSNKLDLHSAALNEAVDTFVKELAAA
jgi:methyl-accepting chemotaxis protein